MEKEQLHEYHFVMDSDMKRGLRELKVYERIGSLSGVIEKILLLLTPVVEREHKWGEQRFAKYMPVNEDPEVRREHMHAYFPVSLYRRLKLMHADLNCYSIAQLVRGFLAFYLALEKKYGDNIFDELRKLFKQWELEDKKTRLSPNKFMRQLKVILQHLPGQNRLVSIYDRQFSPFWIFRL